MNWSRFYANNLKSPEAYPLLLTHSPALACCQDEMAHERMNWKCCCCL